jgi:alginate O-acetyltransferase complex protein AlgI
MVFTTHIFLFYFLPAVLLIYYSLPFKWRNLFLTLASYVFYGWWEPWFVVLMMISTVVDYFCGRAISRPGATQTQRLGGLLTAIFCDMGLLAFFKYYTFTAENLNKLLHLVGPHLLPVLQITLPIGISFYTFESMSYTIDVYRGVVKPARSFSDLSCFISLFPHLVAGPIVRYNVIAEQLAAREHSWEKFSTGVALFIVGFAKKILLANPMGGVADAVFTAQSPYFLDAWFGVIAYAFQIYFDFSGYSDMAVGLSRMFGLVIPKNFASPYRAESITDFWRRWHISLSTWLRDYLYVPMGGNRQSQLRTYFNLTVVMLLGGLWHGASWTFVIWGAYHGILLAFERWFGKRTLYAWLPYSGRVAVTFVLVLFSWVLFRSTSFPHALSYLKSMFGGASSGGASLLLASEIYTPHSLTIFGLCTLLSFQRLEVYDWVEGLNWTRSIVLVPLLVLAVMTMFTQTFNPFLYFQF